MITPEHGANIARLPQLEVIFGHWTGSPEGSRWATARARCGHRRPGGKSPRFHRGGASPRRRNTRCSRWSRAARRRSGTRPVRTRADHQIGGYGGLIFSVTGINAPQRHVLELLAFRDPQIRAKRPGWCKVFHRVRTSVPTTPTIIGEHVHKKRKDLGLHQWQRARLLGVWRSTLGSWEGNPQRQLSLPTGKCFCRCGGQSLPGRGQGSDKSCCMAGFDPHRE